MKREIKFRGKRIENGEWVHGFYWACLDPCIEETRYKGHFIHNGVNIQEPYEVDPETVEQFTGLKDKNGKEIYEGDKDLISTVVFIDGAFWTDYKDSDETMLLIVRDDFTVSGVSHENLTP